MKRFPAISNGAGPSGSAATALIAIWTVVASAASVSAAGAIEAQSMLLAESTSMRAMVAVVAAVAKEMLGVETTLATSQDVEPDRPPMFVSIALVIDKASWPSLRLPQERLLDLPPPAC